MSWTLRASVLIVEPQSREHIRGMKKAGGCPPAKDFNLVERYAIRACVSISRPKRKGAAEAAPKVHGVLLRC
jgi:hypothetical protein